MKTIPKSPRSASPVASKDSSDAPIKTKTKQKMDKTIDTHTHVWRMRKTIRAL